MVSLPHMAPVLLIKILRNSWSTEFWNVDKIWWYCTQRWQVASLIGLSSPEAHSQNPGLTAIPRRGAIHSILRSHALLKDPYLKDQRTVHLHHPTSSWWQTVECFWSCFLVLSPYDCRESYLLAPTLLNISCISIDVTFCAGAFIRYGACMYIHKLWRIVIDRILVDVHMHLIMYIRYFVSLRIALFSGMHSLHHCHHSG